MERKTFPGYVLLKMVYTDESWYIVKSTRGVTGFVGPASEPTPLSEKEVEALGVSLDAPAVEVNISAGDSVRVSGTAMDGFVGVVQKVDVDNGTVDVLVSMFGRETPATLSLTQVIRLDDI